MQDWSAAGRARKKRPFLGLENRPHAIEHLETRLVLAGAPVAPLGSLVFEEQIADEISSLGQTKSFQLDLDPGQKLSLVVATDEDLVAETELVDPNGTTLAADVGTELTFQTLSIDLGGTYTLTVRGEDDSTGRFTIQVWHNAAIEMEQHGGLGNSTVSTAQDMSGSFISLGDGVAARGAVIGGRGSEDDTEEWISFILDDGQTATLALAELSGPTGATLELYDETLTRLALGVGSSGAEQVIHNFTDLTTDGASAVYFAHIINPPEEFNLVVTRDSDFDADGGKAFSLAEQITPTRSVLGHVKEAVGAALDPLTTFPGPSFGGFIPPDPIHAVGLAQIVAMVNTEIAIYDKAGNRLFRQSTNGTGGFFGSVGATTTVFDPWVTYDPVSQRFFALGIELTTSTKSHVYLAVSTDETPTSGADWHKYKLDFTHIPDGTGLGGGPHFPDYPKMSVSEDAVFISGNYFAIGTGSGRYVGVTALDKTSMLNGSGATKLYEEHFEGFTVFPLQHFDNSQTQYFAESVGTSAIRIHAITDVLTAPARVTHDLTVPEFGPPIDVPQLGGGVPADTVSERVMTGVWRDGSAWFAHPITDPAIGDQETVSRWYEVATNDFPAADPTLIQSGNVDPGPGLHAWSPAISVDAAGNMAIGVSLGGPDQFLGAGYTGRLDSDSLGTTTSPVFEYVSGQANYVLTDGIGRNRWGDYSGMSIDPADDSTFWVFNQYSSSSNKWATRIGSFQLDAIPESDWYQFEVDAGETIAIETFTPFGEAGVPGNALDPYLELYAPDGTLLAQDDNSGTDGRNATITHTALAAGAYRVRTYPANGTEGDYVVSVSPPNNTGDPSPTILDTTPDDGQRVGRFPTDYTVRLPEHVLATSVEPSDLRVNGVPATDVVLTDGNTLVFTLDATSFSGDGVYSVDILAGSLDDLQGNTLAEAFVATFELDTQGPRISGIAWNGGVFPPSGVLPAGPLLLEATFSEELFIFASPRRGPFSAGKDDVVLTDTDTGQIYEPTAVQFDASTDTFAAEFDQELPEGKYSLRLISGEGAFVDDVGNGLDGEPIGLNADGTPTGDATPGGDYLVNFALDNATSIPPTPFERLNPAGSLVFSSVGTEGLIFDATDEDFITLFVHAGETIAAAVTFEQPVVGTVELAGVSDTIVGTAGQTVFLPPTIISADGLFDLRISADGPSRYTVDIYLNAGIEGEVGDSSDGNELALDSTFVGAGTGRFAVVGNFDESSPDFDEYTLNLSGKAGISLDIVLAGNGVDLSDQTLELLGPSGTVVATASGSFENFDLGILDFSVPSSAGDNVYTLRVSSHVPGQYTLAAVEWQTFDAEPNNESAARSLDDDGRAIGYLTADQGVVIEPDDYPVNTVLDTAVGGVTLSEFSTGNSVFAALATSYIPPTGTQVFGNETAGPAGWILGGGEMRADFDRPVSAVSIAFGSNSALGDNGVLYALDDDDNILEILFAGTIPPNASETLSIVRPQRDIYAVAAAGLVDRAPVDRMTFSAVVPDTVDAYRVEASAGDVITVSTATPFDQSPGLLGNSLDPELRVVHPDGNTVVASDMNGIDGKNASVTFIASVAGTYTIEVKATSGLGEYLLELDRATPDAIDDALVAPQGGTVTLLDSNAASVLANDLGLTDAPVKVVLGTPPAHAANFILNANGTFSYEHDGSQELSDSFTYTLVDYNGDSDVASVSVTVTPSETSIPDAKDDAINIEEGSTATQLVGGETTLQANDLHLDDVPIVVSIETSPQYASSFVVNPDGTFSYQHDGSENFIDSFSYRVTDANGDFDTATVAVAITPVSDSTPDAITDAITVIKGGLATQINGGAISLLDNDLGLDDTPITITVETEPAHAASFAINPDGTFSYEHDGGEESLDVFIYRTTDNDGEFDLATVTVAITPASNSNPDAIEDAITLDEGTTTTQLDSGESSLLANDTGLDDAPVTVEVETPPNYAASFAINADGTFSYTHDGSENLADSFVYRVTDSEGDFDTAVVTISVNPVSDTTPVAVDDAITVGEGDAATMLDSGETSLLTNDFGLSDVPIVIAVETPPSHAADFQIHDDGTFMYRHDGSPDFVDSFVYRITDNDGQSDSAIVAITITPLDDTIPNAIDDTINVDEGAAAVQLAGGEASLLANDLGLQDVPILVVVETPPLHAASFVVNDDGTFRYVHDGSENFSDSFVYRITDNSGKSDTAVVFVSITPVSDAVPDAMDDSLSVIEGDTATQLDSGEFTLLANDVGLEDSPLQITVESPPSHAADFVINADGTFRYQHDGSFNPVDSFVYRIVDNDGESDTATVTIDITLLNEDTPDAMDDELAVNEGAIATQLSNGQNSLLANDLGLTDGGIVVTVEVPPAHAADLVTNDDGTFRYVHDGSENFIDSFVYRVTDRDGEFDTATVSVTVAPISDSFPVAIGDEIEVSQGAMTTQLADGQLSLLDDDVNLRDLPIIASIETPPAHAASFVIQPDGTFRYEHDGTDSLSDSFVYRITDNDGEFDTATVDITVNPITGSAPDAADDQLFVDHAGSTSVTQAGGDSLLANDVGLEDGPILVALVSGPSHAIEFTLNPNGTFSYTHDGGSDLSDSLVYRLTDSHGDADEAIVSITIGPQSLATPSAIDDNTTVEEGGTTTVLSGESASVLTNDLGLLDLPINVVLEAEPVHAFAFVLNPDGTFRYEHDGSENFRDSFVYRITDNDGETDIATVEIAISPVSDAEPNAADDSITVAEGGVATQLVSGAASVLANDSGLDDAPITVSLDSKPSHADSFDFRPDGTFAYQHNGSENFADSFVYTLTDNDGQASTATVSIQITRVSDAEPVATADSISVSEGQTATVLDSGATSVLDNDSGLDDAPITIEVTSKPLHAATFDLQPDGSFIYEHDGSENFVDAFEYLIRDNDGQFSTATVTVNIERVSDTEPAAADDSLTVSEGGVAVLLDSGADNLLSNDAGLDDGPMLVVLATPPSHAASFAVDADGTFRYEHDGSENFTDSFSYSVTDNDGQSATATVNVAVLPVSDATPVASDDAADVDEGGSISVLVDGSDSLLANDGSLDDGPILIQVEVPPVHAAAFEIFEDGTLFYEHDGSENFTDSFVYRITDNDGESDTATVSISVTAVSDTTPAANADAIRVSQGGVATALASGDASLLANDTGLEDTPVIAALDTPPAYAVAFELNDDGTFRYEHDGSENLSDSFVYSIVDNDGQASTATVTIDVVPGNDDTEPPSAIASAADITLGGTDAQQIVVQYTDNVGIQVTDLDDNDVYVVTPAGQEIPAMFVAIGDNDAKSAAAATYEIFAPSDGWSPAQNGLYRILIRENEVRDPAGNAVPGGEIGQFTIQIPSPPVVSSVQRDDGREDFSRLSSLAFQFNAEVTVQPGAFRLINASSDQPIDTSSAEFTYDAANRVATWNVGNLSLAIGSYRVVLAANQVIGNGGVLLDGNGDGEPGDDYEPDRRFPVTWAGDADLDLDVDFTDFVALAENFGKEADSLWSEGDFDGDGAVNFSDFVFLAENFAKSLSPAAAAAPPATGLTVEPTAAVDALFAIEDRDQPGLNARSLGRKKR